MKTMKRMVSLILAVITLCSVIAIPTYAASAWPSLSSSGYCEMIAPGKVPVYRDSSLTTPGTSSPAKSYSAYVSRNDKVYILNVTGDYALLSYPTSSGRRIGYVKTSTLLGVTAPTEMITSKAKVTTYTGASTTSRSGSTAVGDVVYKLGTTKSGYALIMYSAVSGARAMKAAFVTKSDYEKIKGNNSNNSGSSNLSDVQLRLKAIGTGELKLNDDTDLVVGHTFVGTKSNEECKGYARNLFNMCFGINIGSTQDNNYKLDLVPGVSHVGSVTKMTEENISALFAHARPGDFVQMRRNNSRGGPHSMIIYSVRADGINVLEANTDGRNTICANSYTWSDLCNKNVAMSVYTASNYTLK